jgi:hypothetical protein
LPFLFYCSIVFIEEIFLRFQTGPSTFFFLFFFNFDFSFFLYFLKRAISTSTQKIGDCKINALKVERVQNIFKNFNSSKMTLKMLKMMQIYQNAFFGVFVAFFYF